MNEWILWNGGDCPVPAGTEVRALLRGGAEVQTSVGTFSWTHSGRDSDIVSYRIVGEKPATAAPYGVPCGYVPRSRIDKAMGQSKGSVQVRFAQRKGLDETNPTTHHPATLRPYPPDHPEQGTSTLPDFGVHGSAIQRAVDDYLLMERKARAWEKLALWAHMNDAGLFDRMDKLVQTAQERSTS